MKLFVKKYSEKRFFEEVTYLHCSIKVIKLRMFFNVYFFEGTLIDTGPTSMTGDLHSFFKALPIEQVAITHIHEDHCGHAAWLQKEKKAKIFVPEPSIADCRKSVIVPKYREIVWGNREGFEPAPLPSEIFAGKFKFEVIKTPGHIEDHVAFFCKEKGWLFTGDLFVSVKQNLAFISENIAVEMETLKKLLAYDFEYIFCPHSGINKNGKELIKKKYDYFLSLKEKIRDLQLKSFSEEEIEKKLFNRFHPFKLVSKGEWSAKNLIRTI